MIQQAIKQLHDSLETSKNAFTGTQFSTLHTDIWSLNVVWNESKPTFVDWEDMCFGDPADELAYILAINNVSEHFKTIFMQAYLQGTHDPFFMERLDIYTLKARLFDLIWSIKKLDEEAQGQPGHIQKAEGIYENFYNVRLVSLRKYMDKT